MPRLGRFAHLFALALIVGLLVPAFRSSCGRLGVPMPCCAKGPGESVPPCCAVDRAPDPVNAAHERVQVPPPLFTGAIAPAAAVALPAPQQLEGSHSIALLHALAPPGALPLRV